MATYTINSGGKLLEKGKAVRAIPARRAHTNGPLSPVPKIAIIHFTYGGTGASSANWFADPTNPNKSSAHVVIDRDGSVIQCVDFTIGANHAGKSSWNGINSFNDKSFGVELANWGYLKSSGSGWTSYTGVNIADPVLAEHKNGNPAGSGKIGWEPYPDAQVATAIAVVQALVTTYGVDTILGHDDISVGRKWDPGPAFDMTRFRNHVFGDRAENGANTFRVASPSGLNLRKGPGIHFDVIMNLADGSLVTPVQESGSWVMVNTLDNALVPQITGWVNRSFLI